VRAYVNDLGTFYAESDVHKLEAEVIELKEQLAGHIKCREDDHIEFSRMVTVWTARALKAEANSAELLEALKEVEACYGGRGVNGNLIRDIRELIAKADSQKPESDVIRLKEELAMSEETKWCPCCRDWHSWPKPSAAPHEDKDAYTISSLRTELSTLSTIGAEQLVELQELRQVVKLYRDEHTRNWYCGTKNNDCPICVKADPLLAAKPEVGSNG
jgi:hypothetical protein